MSTPDELEQGMSPTGDLAPPATPEVPLEAEAADVAEQAAPTGPEGHNVLVTAERDLPLEAPEGDAVEQGQVVPLDEDERQG